MPSLLHPLHHLSSMYSVLMKLNQIFALHFFAYYLYLRTVTWNSSFLPRTFELSDISCSFICPVGKRVLLWNTGFIRVREMSGKFKIFQGQGIVREFHNLSGKIEFLLKCQGDVREF